MKNFLILTILLLAGSLSASSQTNEFYTGYSFTREDVKIVRPVFAFDNNTDSHGALASYTRYVKDNFIGITGEVAGTYKTKNLNSLSVMGGLTLKSRGNKYVEPFLKGLIGVTRKEVGVTPFASSFNTREVAFSYLLGGGLDFKTKSKVKVRFGVDLLNTEFYNDRHNAVRLHTGLVF